MTLKYELLVIAALTAACVLAAPLFEGAALG